MPIQFTTGAILGINFDGRLFGQQILLTSYWRCYAITPGTDVFLEDLIPELVTKLDTLGQLGDQVAGSYSEDVTNLTYIFQLLYPTRYVKFSAQMGDDTGEVAEPSLPPNVAHVLTLRRDVAVPPIRSNKHIGGVPASWSVDGLLAGGGPAQMENLATALSSEIDVTVGADTVDFEPIIFDRADPASSVTITNHIVSTTTRVERRRTVGLGS